ncbi:MAG: trigger factor [Subdoligranulum sp.]|nr:trigger factor [Subdoligranulum sp.]
MNLVKNEKLENNQHELHIAIDAEAFNAGIVKAFKREAGKYNIPGFRRGKAPRHMIEKMFGADVFHYDAINALFPDAYEAAIAESGIEPVDRPEVEIVSASTEDGVVLKAVVTVKPEMKVGAYRGLKAVKKVHTVEDAAIMAEIDRMRERNARIITREGAAENGDITDIDFDGSVDGVPFEGGKAEHFSLTLGSGQFIPGFEEQVVGHAVGEEFDVNVTFPEQYQAEELAGKAAVFKIKLHEVKTRELPEADDEFAKDVSEYDTLDELKASIRKGMEEQNEKNAELEVENDLVDQIVGTLEGEIPPVMFETRVTEMVRDFEYRMQQQGLGLEDYLKYTGSSMEQFREGFREQAEKQVKIRLALEAVAHAEGIVASDEDFENELQRIAEAYKMEVEKVRGIVPEADVKKDLAVNKAIDLVKENAEITVENVTDENGEEDKGEEA